MKPRVPWHPALVHLPAAAWTAAPALGVAAGLGGPVGLWPVAWWCGAVGVLTALPAMVAGLMDLAALEAPAAKDLALWHMGGMSTAWCLELAALLLARPDEAFPGFGLWLLAVTLAFVVMAVSAHLGGRLVYVHGAGVMDTAD